MMPDESLSRHRAFISPSMSAPTFPTFTGSNRRSPSPAPAPLRPSPSSSSASSSSSARRPPSSFSHNPRVALALVPAALFLLDLGGAPVIAILTVGLMAAYILDSLRLAPAAPFFVVWFSLLAAQLAFFLSASVAGLPLASLPLTALALLLCAETTFLIGVWASLNFRWIQIENAPIVPALERLLFACLPVTAPALFAWAAVAALGIANAAYYHMAFACVFYWLFAVPRPSSFKSKLESSSAAADDQILGPLEGCLHVLHLLFVPPLFFIASHHATIFSSILPLCDVLLLFFVPLLFLLYASTRGALWWVTKDPYQTQRIRIVNGAVALIVIMICLEIRVVFHSFGKYLHASPPMSILLVTVALLGGASAVGAYAVGMVQDAVSSVAFTTVVMFVSAAGAVVVGFPKAVSV